MNAGAAACEIATTKMIEQGAAFGHGDNLDSRESALRLLFNQRQNDVAVALAAAAQGPEAVDHAWIQPAQLFRRRGGRGCGRSARRPRTA
jgi:hypothetical protein